MKDLIYLVIDNDKVKRMTKSLPSIYRGEVIVKLDVNVSQEAFDPPTLSQQIFVDDWRKGIDLDDVEFRQSIITEEEAETIRQRRLEKMREILEAQGFEITKPEEL